MYSSNTTSDEACWDLFDCVKSTQHQLPHRGAFNCTEAGIFLSDLHGDHLFWFAACCAVVVWCYPALAFVFARSWLWDHARISDKVDYPLEVSKLALKQVLVGGTQSDRPSAGFTHWNIWYRDEERNSNRVRHRRGVKALAQPRWPTCFGVKAIKTIMLEMEVLTARITSRSSRG